MKTRLPLASADPAFQDLTGAVSNHPIDDSHRDFATSLTTPCQTLSKGIDLIFMAPGKSE